MTIPRIARVPHTAKDPEQCPYCGGHNLTRRGLRKKKLEIVQVWRCASCKRTFTPNPQALRNKTYPLRMILGALEDYNLGYSMAETAKRLKKKTNRSVSPSTIENWIAEYRRHCSYLRLRPDAKTRFPSAQTIRTIKLYHRQIYAFSFHRAKLEMLRNGTLDDRRAGPTRRHRVSRRSPTSSKRSPSSARTTSSRRRMTRPARRKLGRPSPTSATRS
jgi:transposase-like protein